MKTSTWWIIGIAIAAIVVGKVLLKGGVFTGLTAQRGTFGTGTGLTPSTGLGATSGVNYS